MPNVLIAHYCWGAAVKDKDQIPTPTLDRAAKRDKKDGNIVL